MRSAYGLLTSDDDDDAAALGAVGVVAVNPTVSSLVMTVVLVSLALLLMQHRELRRSCYLGIVAWGRWLPVAAVGAFVAILAINIATGGAADTGPFGLGRYLSLLEMITLFLVGPLFLTRLGNILATATTLYCLERLVTGPTPAELASMGLHLLAGSATIIALLADKMPWHVAASGPSRWAQRYRELMLTFLTLVAMAAIASCMVRSGAFLRWSAQVLELELARPICLALLAILFLGWAAVALNYGRALVLPLASLPTLLVFAHMGAWPTSFLAIPFAACLALALASADRRQTPRRRAAGLVGFSVR